MNKPQKNWLEWSVFALGLVLVVGSLGYLVQYALTLEGRPPIISAQTGQPRQQAGSYIVPVTVANDGDQTAEHVQIEVQISAVGVALETTMFELDFLPSRSKREAWASFVNDPTGNQLRARVVAYQKP
ncbi:MAG: hypothetical protein H7X91_06385 [Burkholderiales bacterium]|nr:hypothetical protein [Burkholderiales bacterium]